jgi:hypothetical protein
MLSTFHFFLLVVSPLVELLLCFPNFNPYIQKDVLGGLLENCCEKNHLPFLYLLQINLIKIMPYGVFQLFFKLFICHK